MCLLASTVPRHGAGRVYPRAALLRRALVAHVADRFPAATAALASSHIPLPRHHLRWSELRLRTVRAPHDPGGTCAIRPRVLEVRRLWRRACARRHHAAIHRRVWCLRVHACRISSVLRAGGGDTNRVRGPRAPADRHSRGRSRACPCGLRPSAGRSTGGRGRSRQRSPLWVRRGR